MSTPPKKPPTDAERDLAELEYRGRRHVENLEGLLKIEQYHTGEIERLDSELVTLRAALAKVPPTTAHGTYECKKQILDLELARDLALEDRARLQPEIAAAPKLIAANAKAIAALKAEDGS